MRSLHRLLPAALLAMGGTLSGLPAGLNLPPITGELSGNLALRNWPELPPFAWRVTAVTQGAGTKLELSTTAPGLVLRVEATLPADGVAGTWRVVEGTAEVAAWLRIVTARAGLAALPDDLEMSGGIRLAGEGTWQGAEFAGTITSVLVHGSARSAAQGWEAAEIAVTSELDVMAGDVILRSAQVRIGSVQAAGVAVRNLQADAAGAAGGWLEIRRVELDVFGGHVSLAPFGFNPAEPVVEIAAAFSNVSLGDLALLVPQALAEAHGRMAGRIVLRWSAAAGFEPVAGSLAVASDFPATVRLAAMPGFLTQRMPRRIALLPAWLGPVAQWFSPENPAYDALQDIELGRQWLTVENLHLQLYPDGPDAPRSALVELAARPAAAGAVERVIFTVNVAGPLDQVLRLGFNGGVKVNVGAGP